MVRHGQDQYSIPFHGVDERIAKLSHWALADTGQDFAGCFWELSQEGFGPQNLA